MKRMPNYRERPKRKAAIEARAKLHQQAEHGRRKGYTERDQELHGEDLGHNEASIPMKPRTPCGHQLAAPAVLPRPSTDLPRLPAGRVAEIDPRQDEDSLPPVPTSVQISGSPEYLLDKKLGKGGFGQVYLGRRAVPTRINNGPQANHVAIKLEHKNSKGCNYGPPYEWNVYK